MTEDEKRLISRWEIIRCRWAGHKCGPVWYNPGALEPDMRCVVADNRMTAERIAEIKARCAAATEGPWAWCNTGDKGGASYEIGCAVNEAGESLSGEVERDDLADTVLEGPYIGGIENSTVNLDDARFISHARTDLPDAIARIEHLEAALRAVMERKGPYSQNPLKHAENTIWNMADLARRGLEGEEL